MRSNSANSKPKTSPRAHYSNSTLRARLYMNGTLRSWMHYIELRGANGTQKEHVQIAHECAKAIAEIFPLAKDLV